jgi:hypothetical protein
MGNCWVIGAGPIPRPGRHDGRMAARATRFANFVTEHPNLSRGHVTDDNVSIHGWNRSYRARIARLFR